MTGELQHRAARVRFLVEQVERAGILDAKPAAVAVLNEIAELLAKITAALEAGEGMTGGRRNVF